MSLRLTALVVVAVTAAGVLAQRTHLPARLGRGTTVRSVGKGGR